MRLARALRNVFSNYTNTVVQSLVALILTPVLFNYLHAEDYAILFFALATSAAVEAVDLGMLNSLVRYISIFINKKSYKESRELASSAFYLLLALGITGASALVLSSSWIVRFFGALSVSPARASLAVEFVGFGVIFQLPCAALTGHLWGCGDFHLSNAVDVCSQAIRAGAVIALLLLGYGLIPVALVFPAVAFLRMLGMLVACRRSSLTFAPSLRDVKVASLKEIKSFASLSFLEDITTRYYLLADTFMAARLLPLADLAILNVARKLPQALPKLSQQTHWVAYPMVSAASSEGNKQAVERYLLVSTRTFLALGLPFGVGLYVWADTILRLWVGNAVIAGVPVLRLMVVFAFFFAAQEAPLTFLYAAGKIGFSATLAILILTGFVVSAEFACPRFGLNGLALAYSMVSLVGAALIFWKALKISEIGLRKLLVRGILPGVEVSALPVAWLFLSTRIMPHSVAGLSISIAVGMILFAAILLRIASQYRSESWKNRIRSLLVEIH